MSNSRRSFLKTIAAVSATGAVVLSDEKVKAVGVKTPAVVCNYPLISIDGVPVPGVLDYAYEDNANHLTFRASVEAYGMLSGIFHSSDSRRLLIVEQASRKEDPRTFFGRITYCGITCDDGLGLYIATGLQILQPLPDWAEAQMPANTAPA